MTASSSVAKKPPSGYSVLLPPGWRQFSVDVAGEKAAIDIATGPAREMGRADVVLVIRRHIHQTFESLRRRRARCVYLPVESPEGTAQGLSLVVVPVRGRGGASMEGVAGKLAGPNHVESLTIEGGTWYRWSDRIGAIEGDSRAGSLTLHYLIPRPGVADTALHLAYTILALTEEFGSAEMEAKVAIGHTIVGTFQWREAA